MHVFEKHESEVRGYCRSYPAVFTTADNARMMAEDGTSYIDFFAGAGVLNFGHNHPEIKQALISYLEEGGIAHSLDLYTAAKRDFIKGFYETILAPRNLDYKFQFPAPTGTNAVEAALKLARKVTHRPTIAAFTNGFHGMTLGALACTGNKLHRAAAGVTLDHVHRLPFDGYTENSMAALESYRKQLKDGSSGLFPPAAFLVETIQAEGGVNIASKEWLRAVQDLAREFDSLFIVDDIQVGCGRTGAYFSWEDLGLDPDIICLAKGIGGYGIPLAMLLIKPGLDQWKPGEHTGTFRGQDLSFVAGTQALKFFEDDKLLTEVRKKGEHTHHRLAVMQNRYARLGIELRSKGMIHGLDMGSGEPAKAVVAEAFKRGLVISTCGPFGNVLKVIAPLTIPQADLDQGLDILNESLAMVAEAHS